MNTQSIAEARELLDEFEAQRENIQNHNQFQHITIPVNHLINRGLFYIIYTQQLYVYTYHLYF